LCVATLYRYKNLPRLLEAFALLKLETGIPHRLRVIGGDADMSRGDLKALARRLGVLEVVDFVGPIAHREIAGEYAHASVFIYPSLDETFGLPPLEAMTIGIPVVASYAGSIPEIVGDAAEMVDPHDPIDIARGLRRVLLDAELASSLVRRGTVRARSFSWEATARQTFQVLRSAAG
jgi:glycosyltransferase involved in cell wall biosynthesis